MTLVHQCAIDVYTSFGCFLHVFLVAYDTPPFIDRVGGGGGGGKQQAGQYSLH